MDSGSVVETWKVYEARGFIHFEELVCISTAPTSEILKIAYSSSESKLVES